MNYSNDPEMVRVDFFKDTGKWYTTEAVKWVGYNGLIYDEFEKSLKAHFGDKPRLQGMWAVCLEPYNQNAHPVMMKISNIYGIRHVTY